MEKILRIMRKLRSQSGCPWDRKQTMWSLKRCVLEEAHEVIDAIDSKKKERIEEEIGDMLCVVSLLIAIGEEKSFLDKKRLIRGAIRKMISRHPHVFGNQKARTAEDALQFFQKIKERERKEKREPLFDDLGNSFPALMAAEKIQRKVARVGFDWPNSKEVVKKIEEELTEIKDALRKKNKKKIREEMGDFLFSVVNFARKIGVEAETSLLATNTKFKRRFEKLEKLAQSEGLSLRNGSLSLEKLDSLWDGVKRKEGS